MQGEDINIKKTLQYYPTTDPAGDRLLDGVKLNGKVVFEPSAGEGYIVRRSLAAGAKDVLAVELYEPFHEPLRRAGGRIIGRNIFDVTPDDVANVDVVLMNPPFSGAQDVKHVEYVLSIVPENVEIHAIMSGAVLVNSNRIYEGFRTLLDAFGIKPEDLPAGTFKDSGTQVKSCIVRIPSRRKATLAA
ncbi:type I restriction endonuclease subunit M [Aeromonas caviae]|nr:type I restriction endonuclease subunit M [Aeromonas caviae]